VSDQQPLFPAMPPLKGPEQPRIKPPVPREVNVSFVVWVLTTLFSAVVEIINTDSFVTAYVQQIAGTPQADVLSAHTVKIMYIVASVVVNLVMLFFAWRMRSGRNWARMILAVLAAITLLAQAAQVGISEILPLVSVLVTVTGLVFMFVPASNAYFALFRRPATKR